MQTRGILVLGLAVAVALATGCSEEATNAPTSADFTKERQALAARSGGNKTAGAAAKKTPDNKKATAPGGGSTSYAAGGQDYFYDPTGKRDPFRWLISSWASSSWPR